MRKFCLIPAYILLNFWQQQYVYRLFSFSESIFTKTIFFITLQIRDKNALLENQPESDKNWAIYQKAKNFRQYLAYYLSVAFCINLFDEVEQVINLKNKAFLSKIFIQKLIMLILKAQRDKSNLVL